MAFGDMSWKKLSEISLFRRDSVVFKLFMVCSPTEESHGIFLLSFLGALPFCSWSEAGAQIQSRSDDASSYPSVQNRDQDLKTQQKSTQAILNT